ncbi:MAG: sensor histidine kinase [Anaerovoracaceae bacterium]
MKNRDNSRMTSIARKLNMDFWSRQLASFLLIDILLVGLAVGVFFAWREGIVPQGQEVADRYFIGDGWDSYQYVIESETGEMYRYPISRLVDLLRAPAIVLIVVQVVSLIDDLFFTKKIRKRLRPLYEMAVRTEQLSSLPPDSEKFASFERAISSLDPEEPGARVKTGDKELQSLEIAINNLLDRMRESYRQQERFVSDASHELRTPISVIQGYVNMLDRWGKDDPKILDESIEALKNESEHMKLLIEQLLFLARGDSGRNTLHPENFDLAAMVREVWEESAMIDEGHHYEFEGNDPLPVLGDPALLKQSLRILVQNASKYSEKGGRILLKAKVVEDRPAFIVQDEGMGMAESEVIHVFERFYRSEGARNRTEGGTGLGLSIARWIVDAHGGTIEVLSRPEFGTRFTVKL